MASSKINLHEMKPLVAQAIADGLNELGYDVEVPNEKGEMLFGPECHEVQTIVDQVYTAALNDLQGKVDGLLTALEFVDLNTRYCSEHLASPDIPFCRFSDCDLKNKVKQALAEFKNGDKK